LEQWPCKILQLKCYIRWETPTFKMFYLGERFIQSCVLDVN